MFVKFLDSRSYHACWTLPVRGRHAWYCGIFDAFHRSDHSGCYHHVYRSPSGSLCPAIMPDTLGNFFTVNSINIIRIV